MINVIHAGAARFAAIKRFTGAEGANSITYRGVEIRRATLIGANDIVTRCYAAQLVLEELKNVR